MRNQTITPERWSQIKDIFARVVDQVPDDRAPMLSELCRGDRELQAEIERLLAEHDVAGGFLEGTPSLAAATAATLLHPGETVSGRYEIVEFLGRGGMGEVYEAQDRELNERIAIKMIRYEPVLYRDLMERLRREVQLARRVTHPNVCRVFDLGYHWHAGHELIYLTMEVIKGETLASRIGRQGKLTAREALPIARQLCEALEAAHQAGILHRDFKCGNVMLLGSDSRVRAVVTDFGIARQMQPKDEAQRAATQPGIMVGTPTYMSPEQILGEKLTPASDIYSLGLVLYEMVTGLRPFRGESNWTESLRRLSSDPPPPAAIVPDLDPRWNRTIVRCLQREPPRRFSSARQVVDSLQRRFHHPWKERSQGAKMAAALAVLVLITSGAVAAIPSARHTVRSMYTRLVATGQGGDAAIPDEPFPLRTQAQLYLDRWDVDNNLDQAIGMLNRALELDLNYAPAYASLTLAYYRKNELNPDLQWVKRAEDSAGRALQLNADLADAHLASGVAAMMAGRAGEAEGEFYKAADMEPKNPRPHRWLGLLFTLSAKYPKAEDELSRALALNAEDWQARMTLGYLQYKTTRFADAAANWEQVSKLTPGNFKVLRNLGAAYHMADRDDDAASALQRSLEIKPDANTFGNLGTLRFFQGRYGEAVPAFKKAADLAANQYLVWGNLGDAYRWAPGQASKAGPAYDNAIRLAREALALNPNDVDLKSSLALYLVKSGDRQAALKEIQEVDRMANKPGSALFKSAVVHELSAERDQALIALSAALKAGYPLNEVKQEPELVGLRSDARYQLMLARPSGK